MSKFVRLIMTTDANNNKYYEMKDTDDGFIDITYGRVDCSSIKEKKPISKWKSVYNSKLKKGYKDVTEYVCLDDSRALSDYDFKSNTLVDKFIKLMFEYRDGLVSNTYSVKASSITLKQLDKAQYYLKELGLLITDEYNTKDVNKLLLDLYTIIPRYMSKVQDNLLPIINLNSLIEKEQDKLDAISSQVRLLNSSNDLIENTVLNYGDLLSIDYEETSINEESQYLLDQIKSPIKGLFKIQRRNDSSATFNKSIKYLLHGTRCSSFIPIVQQGMKIRPSGNFSFSGKAYGDGIYFSELVNKSLGYTGYDNDKILLVYEVEVGNPFVYEGWYKGNSFDLCHSELTKRGFDSTYVKPGNGLLNSEIIVYKEDQAKIKYVIWL